MEFRVTYRNNTDISLETPIFRRHFSSQGVVIIQGETLTWISAIFRQNSAQNSANFAFITFTSWYSIDFWTSGLWNNRPFTDFELHTSLVWSYILVIIREQQFQYCLVWGSFCWALDKEKIRLSTSKPSLHQRRKHNTRYKEDVMSVYLKCQQPDLAT